MSNVTSNPKSDFTINTKLFVCVAQFTATPGNGKKLLSLMANLIPETRREVGCIRYELNVSHEDPDQVCLVEKFIDKAAFDSHCDRKAINDMLQNVLHDKSELVQATNIKTYHQVIA